MLTRLLPKSLVLRAITLSTLWGIISVVAVATLIAAVHRKSGEDSLQKLLRRQLVALVGDATLDNAGKIITAPDFIDTQFLEPDSGWYWTVELVENGNSGRVQSPSMGRKSIPLADRLIVPFGVPGPFQRTYRSEGLAGELVQVVESEVGVGDKNVPVLFRVMGNRKELEESVTSFSRLIYLYLTLFGAATILINAAAISFGLNPLRKTSESLKLIREGKSSRLEGEFPPEIAPLASEMNALIDNNRRIVERSRTQVGNLAHALKTPLAVMSNEGQALGGKKGAVISEQTGAMQEQIQRYLQRARVSAQRDSVVYRAAVSPIIAPTLRVMQKLNPDKQFLFVLPKDELVFAGEAEDFQEIIGNLLENAAKWGRKRIELSAARTRSPVGAAMLSVEISDDGPGLSDQQIKAGIKRGKRMDESKPGTGLGLSIVSDTVREYGGELKLGKSALGGLSVTFTLPSVE